MKRKELDKKGGRERDRKGRERDRGECSEKIREERRGAREEDNKVLYVQLRDKQI